MPSALTRPLPPPALYLEPGPAGIVLRSIEGDPAARLANIGVRPGDLVYIVAPADLAALVAAARMAGLEPGAN